MAIDSAWCQVLQTKVTRVMTLEGEVTSVICPQYESILKSCRLKNRVRFGGPLSQLLEGASEQSLTDDSPRCTLA